jgi:hypothetical protein
MMGVRYFCYFSWRIAPVLGGFGQWIILFECADITTGPDNPVAVLRAGDAALVGGLAGRPTGAGRTRVPAVQGRTAKARAMGSGKKRGHPRKSKDTHGLAIFEEVLCQRPRQVYTN